MHTGKKIICLILWLCIFFLGGWSLEWVEGKAAAPKISIVKGVMYFETTDTAATNPITWFTAGFVVTRERCLAGTKANGGYPLKLKHGEFLLDKAWMKQGPAINGKVTVRFEIPEKVVNKALIQAGLDEIQPGDHIYLHGIHQVKHNGRPFGALKYDFPSIKGAEGWANPNDFRDRFDIDAIYKPSGGQKIRETYMTMDGKVIESHLLDPVEPGEMAQVRHEKVKMYKGKEQYLKKSYQNYLETGKRIAGTTNAVSSITARDYEGQLGRVRLRKKKQAPGGLEFVAVMQEKPASMEEDNDISGEKADWIEEVLQAPAPYGTIAADNRYSQQYDVLEGIPAAENLYTNVFSYDFLLGYAWKREKGTKTYPVKANKTYTLTWTETDRDSEGNLVYHQRSTRKTISQTIQVKRKFSYWLIDHMDYFKIKQAEVLNYALPNEKIILAPDQNYKIPKLDFQHWDKASDHIKEPAYPKNITLPGSSIRGGSSCPSIPYENFSPYAEAVVGNIMVRNDSVKFSGQQVMDHQWKEEETQQPKSIEVLPEEIGEDILYRSGMTIDKNKKNGSFMSKGTITYERVEGTSLKPRFSNTIIYPVSNLTEVVIHTPTVCDAAISDEIAYNQLHHPDKSMAGLILDRSFFVSYPTTGSHRYIEGYGYRDYSRYIENRQIRFPFDVYQGKDYYKAGTWIFIKEEITKFYLPIWVKEGKYTVECKAPAINAAASHGSEKKEEIANYSNFNYVAVDTIDVEVSGRLYGLSLYDISDYPLWRPVFRMKDSLKRTGFLYTVGDKNQNGDRNGQNRKYTFPIVNGSHPTIPEAGAVKTGYAIRFYMTTIGNMDQNQDFIHIRPVFYHVNYDGSNRQRVDIYYMETIKGKKQRMVKVGGIRERKNTKAYRTGDEFLTLPEEELALKAGLEGKKLKEMKKEERNLFTYSNIMIPENLRTYLGGKESPTGTIPSGISPSRAARSKQRWYGEYYLPSEIHLVPAGYDVLDYSKKNRVDFSEKFWLQEGYLILNFEIETIQNGKRHLSYHNPINSPYGYCNMWKKEGFSHNKIDSGKNNFKLLEGDLVFFDLKQSAAKDYKSGGTH